eukprot:1633683-Alexandrium_andersonii.AAC.1
MCIRDRERIRSHSVHADRTHTSPELAIGALGLERRQSPSRPEERLIGLADGLVAVVVVARVNDLSCA